MADAPHRMPSQPATSFSVSLPVASATASSAKSTVSEANTSCVTRLRRSVPMNNTSVSTPHMARYAAMPPDEVAVASPVFGSTTSATSDSQKKP